jgi:hypothetical protein
LSFSEIGEKTCPCRPDLTNCAAFVCYAEIAEGRITLQSDALPSGTVHIFIPTIRRGQQVPPKLAPLGAPFF